MTATIEIDVVSLSILLGLAKRAPKFPAEDQWLGALERRAEREAQAAVLAQLKQEEAVQAANQKPPATPSSALPDVDKECDSQASQP